MSIVIRKFEISDSTNNRKKQSPENVKMAYSKLKQFDFTNIDRKFSIKHPALNPKKVRKEFIRFFSLATIMPSIAGSNAVDDYWHEVILDTRKYWKICTALFGKFFHHDPNDGTQKQKNKDEKYFWDTLQKYQENFGEPDPKIWGIKRRKNQ